MASAEYAIDLHTFDDLTPFGLTSPSGAEVHGYVRVNCAAAVNEMAEEWVRVQRLVTRDVMPDEVDEDPRASGETDAEPRRALILAALSPDATADQKALAILALRDTRVLVG